MLQFSAHSCESCQLETNYGHKNTQLIPISTGICVHCITLFYSSLVGVFFFLRSTVFNRVRSNEQINLSFVLRHNESNPYAHAFEFSTKLNACTVEAHLSCNSVAIMSMLRFVIHLLSRSIDSIFGKWNRFKNGKRSSAFVVFFCRRRPPLILLVSFSSFSSRLLHT